jgi:predicted MFS family arabinose efflux permease
MQVVSSESKTGYRSSPAYQALVVGLLSLNFGIVFFDRNALNFLMPLVQPELRLTNFQVGLTGSVLSLAWALSGFAVGRLSDRTGRRRSIIVAATIAFSLCSFVTGLAASFAMLLGARLMMGLAEGGVLPTSQSLTAAAVHPRHRGLAMGIMQNFGAHLLGSIAAPILLVAIASQFGWRSAFYIAGIPGLVTALLIWLFIREPEHATAQSDDDSPRLTLRQTLASKNVALCAAISVLMIACLMIGWIFLPLFLTKDRAFSTADMAWFMSALGVSAVISSFFFPGLSDRIGRRSVLVLGSLTGVALPLACLLLASDRSLLLGVICFAGWTFNGIFPIFMATIPAETVGQRYAATALGLVMGVGELFGGVLGPALAGRAADSFGLTAPLWIMLALCLGSGLLSLFLDETAPRLRRTG